MWKSQPRSVCLLSKGLGYLSSFFCNGLLRFLSGKHQTNWSFNDSIDIGWWVHRILATLQQNLLFIIILNIFIKKGPLLSKEERSSVFHYWAHIFFFWYHETFWEINQINKFESSMGYGQKNSSTRPWKRPPIIWKEIQHKIRLD